MSSTSGSLLDAAGRRGVLARNVLWHLGGTGAPVLVALWAIPVLIDRLGADRFGLLSIIWMGVGYFSLFDLGLGRALTKLVAERLSTGAASSLPALVETGMRLMVVLGLASALLIFFLAPWLVESLFNVPPALRAEAEASFRILALALPLVVSSAGYIGILQGHHRFKEVSLVRIPLGIVSFAGPALASYGSVSLVIATGVLAVARGLAWWAYRRQAHASLEGASVDRIFRKDEARALIRFGGWLAVTNVVGPLMVYGDRFVIGALLTTAAVAHYTAPYDVTTRLLVLPDAAGAVLFPALTAALVTHVKRAAQLMQVASRLLMPLVALPCVLAILFAHEALSLWIGPEFADEGARVMQWLAVGVFLNALARLPLNVIQGQGRADLTGKLHLFELPIYVVALYWAVDVWGIEGVAIVWTGRMLIDTVILFLAVGLVQPALRGVASNTLVRLVGISVVLTALMSLEGEGVRLGIAALMTVIAALEIFVQWRRWGQQATEAEGTTT